ncbi:hypothetical protein J1N09_03145 [Aureitalea sp. L0-47]|uniref:DUF6602 domain-containing protein n=1 Tax=Aureitalea sp. L0-47 TaxID=2816962 RepID=UPI00223854F5|nr:DUF6602 domain-containing protein [Aureitalea sp. L0-47]MCW5518818.1 hypothetical protein [Aureitalea sp. L0-47]
MNNLFKNKLENIHNNMLECHRDSQKYSSSIIGDEREIFQTNLLSKILPSNYRFGSGTITDSKGRETGQIDTVIELPFSLSFPVSTGNNRLYLADSVGAAFEIKSDLNKQWHEAIEKIKEIQELNRYTIGKDDFALLDDLKIPTFIIAYKGFKKLDTIYKKLEKVESRYWPNGILVIESGIFLGLKNNSHYECTGNSTCILGFVSHLYGYLNRYSKNIVDLDNYSNLLK